MRTGRGATAPDTGVQRMDGHAMELSVPDHAGLLPGMYGGGAAPCPEVSPGGMMAEGRIVEAVADGAVLRGTLADLARRLHVRAEDLVVALGELVAVGWLRVAFEDGQMSLRWKAVSPRRPAEAAIGRLGRRPSRSAGRP